MECLYVVKLQIIVFFVVAKFHLVQKNCKNVTIRKYTADYLRYKRKDQLIFANFIPIAFSSIKPLLPLLLNISSYSFNHCLNHKVSSFKEF